MQIFLSDECADWQRFSLIRASCPVKNISTLICFDIYRINAIKGLYATS
ncbi:hypothetical protein QUF80_04590 [Desulfococcaceae bacterium HSG8]|nr:hypothetical protein [Desulfococcaceae bacterium HSG8]